MKKEDIISIVDKHSNNFFGSVLIQKMNKDII